MNIKNACPLCGCRRQEFHPADADLIVCTNCQETLYPSELVILATPLSRAAYRRRNGV